VGEGPSQLKRSRSENDGMQKHSKKNKPPKPVKGKGKEGKRTGHH